MIPDDASSAIRWNRPFLLPRCSTSAPRSAPAFQVQEKPEEKVQLARLGDGLVPWINKFLGWALRAGVPANPTAGASGNVGIQHWHRKIQGSREEGGPRCRDSPRTDIRTRCSIVFRMKFCRKFEAQFQFLRRQRSSSKTIAQLFEHAVEHERERLKQNNGEFEFDCLLKNRRWLDKLQRALTSPSCELL